jgi:hypothetical protein
MLAIIKSNAKLELGYAGKKAAPRLQHRNDTARLCGEEGRA